VKVLVTGASGFLGRHLTRHLAAQGCTVVAASRTSIPARDDMMVASGTIASLDGRTEWKSFLERVDVVVHLAGVAHRAIENQDSLAAELQRVNVEATVRLYEQCRTYGVAHFIFISSLAAITSRGIGRIDDATPPTPSTPYGRSKRSAEEALISLQSRGGVDYTILRPPLIYGAGNPANMGRLLQLVRSGLPLPLAAVRNQRSFLYVGNFCDAVYHCLALAGSRNRMFYLSDGEDLSTPELIRRMAHAARVPVRLFPFPLGILRTLAAAQPDGALAKLIGSLYVEISAVRTALEWSPPFSVDAGLHLSYSRDLVDRP